jgi:outer membrane protein TolC
MLRKPVCQIAFACFLLCGLPGTVRASAQVSLSTVVDLAMKNSTSVRIAAADVRHAAGALAETKDAYLPSVILGSSIGPPPYGFPLSTPDLYDVSASSLVISFSQPDYIRSARTALKAAELSLKDAQDQVAADSVLSYIQLNHDLEAIHTLDDEKTAAEKLTSIEQERVIAGVDPRVEQLKAELVSAQVDLKRLHLVDDAEQMRQKLAHLTGMPGDVLDTQPSSIPPSPNFSANGELDKQLTENNAGVAAAFVNAQSKLYQAFGDKRQNFRPNIGFGLKYQRFAKFDNYTEYYHNFQQNNISAGVEMTFPLFDPSRKAKAVESAAEAEHAKAQADQTRDTVSEQVLTLRKSLVEITAQQRVAEIQSELAQEQLKAVETQLQSGSGSPNAAPVTPKEAQQARIEERQRYSDVLDTNFQLSRVQIGLLRATGQLADWLHSKAN